MVICGRSLSRKIQVTPCSWYYNSYLKIWLETQELELQVVTDSWLEDGSECMRLKIESLAAFVVVVHFVEKELFWVLFDAYIFHLRSDDSIRTKWKIDVIEIWRCNRDKIFILTKNLLKSMLNTFVLAFANNSFSIFLAKPQRLICSALDIPGKMELIAWILSQI